MTRESALTDLQAAVSEFHENYEKFAQKNRKFIRIGDDVWHAFQKAGAQQDVKGSAQVFRVEILSVMRIMERKEHVTKAKWTGRVGNFLTSLYPVARLSLQLTSAIAEILEDNADRADDFYFYLKRIEYQTARLAENPNFDLDMEITQSLMQKKSIGLMTAVVEFFNSALLYFSRDSFANLLKGVSGEYDDRKKKLEVAIGEYDQAVVDLAAFIIVDMKYQQQIVQQQKQDEEFLRWLSPSHWLVEGQLHSFRQQRREDTLQWARNMPEFQKWRRSETGLDSKERILWIRGTLGIGKSIMAGHFIDLLKCLHPTAIVAYFFCRSGQAGLMKPRDIVRTLAYQFIRGDKEARSVLETLRAKDFKIEDNLGVGFLTERLLLDPLRHSKKEIFIVLDGLDEADSDTMDVTERVPRPELEVLLERLATLSAPRFLFISRPEANIGKIIPNSITKPIGQTENQEDIDSYVNETIRLSERLQTHFTNAEIDPIEYFHSKANGIFLWVVLVLKQLAKARSTSTFQKHLRGFSEASGDMDLLYSKIMVKFDEEAQIWLKEVVTWLVVAGGKMELETLREIVELSLDDTLPDFHDFIDLECGSILQLVESELGVRVELVHATFRSFLVNQKVCPEAFYVNETIAHSHAVVVCLDALSDQSTHRLKAYAAKSWAQHLQHAEYSCSILSALRHFFESGGCRQWLQYGYRENEAMFPRDIFSLDIDMELNSLEEVRCWIIQADKKLHLEMQNNSADLQWARAVSNEPEIFRDYIGKAAADLWLHELLTMRTAKGLFCLALKSFCKNSKIRIDCIEDLQSLASNEFAVISTWLGDEGRVLRKLNLGTGYWMLRKWNEAVTYLESSERSQNSDLDFRFLLAIAYIKTREYDKAIEVLVSINANDETMALWTTKAIIHAYKAKGDMDAAINALEADISRHPPSYNSLLWLGHIYRLKGDHDEEIRVFTTEAQRSPELWWAWQRLSEAYMVNGRIEEAIESSRGALELYAGGGWALSNLENLRIIRNDSESVNILRSISEEPIYNDGWSVVVNRNSSYRVKLWLKHSVELAHTPHILRFSEDGSCIAVVSLGYVQIYNSETGMKIATIIPEDEGVSVVIISDACFCAGSRNIAIATTGSVIAIWDIANNVIVKRLVDKGSRIYTIGYSSFGELLVTGAADGVVTLWDIKSGTRRFSWKTRETAVVLYPYSFAICVDFVSGGRLIAANTTTGVFLWNTEDGTFITHLETVPQVPVDIAHSSNQNVIFSATRTGVIKVSTIVSPDEAKNVGVGAYQQVKEWKQKGFPDHPSEDTIWSVCCGEDGKWVFAVDHRGSVHLWDEDGQIQLTLLVPLDGMESLMLSTDCLVNAGGHVMLTAIAHSPVLGNTSFVTGGTDSMMRVWQYEIE